MLHFENRNVKSSKKNVMLEYKSRVDDKLKVCLQHGAINGQGNGIGGGSGGKMYALDFAYPFTPI